MKKKTDITTIEQSDLIKDLGKLREELRTSRFSLGAEGKNVKARRTLRKDVARIMTENNRRTRQQA